MKGAARTLLAVVSLSSPLGATPVQDPLARGRTAMLAWDLVSAQRHLQEAVAIDPNSYEANWRLAHVLLDRGKVFEDSVTSPERDSLYHHAESYARNAVRVNPEGADGHFLLASAIGRTALAMGKRERLERAVEIRHEALKALGIDPDHDGAHHVMGRWHAEILRLSALQRFVARRFLGAAVLSQASAAEAERHLRRAVALRPDHVYHRLGLAEILVDREEWTAARLELRTIETLPPREPMDSEYKRQAAELRRRLPAPEAP